MKRRTTLLLALALGVAAFAPIPLRVQARSMRKVPIFFHVAVNEGAPVATDRFLAEQLDHANAIYKPMGITLSDVGHATLPRRHLALVSRDDRDALTRYLRPGVLNCMIVGSLMDVDEPGRERRGVHWRQRTTPTRHFVIVSAISGPYVLAHELGHFFGNREHSDTVGNLMSYQHTSAVPVLTQAQIARVHETLEQMVLDGELSLSQR